MNILFGALFIVILILPGIIFRVSYLNIPYARKTFRSSFIDELLFSLVPALIIQVPCYSIVNYCMTGVDERIIYLLLVNSDKVLQYPLPDKDISLFLVYTLIVTVIAWWLGKGFRAYVNARKLYFRMPIFRFYNDWHYIFKGLLLDAPGQPGESRDVGDVWVDALVNVKDEGSYLYSGYLKQYILSPEDGLDRICLTHVQRRKLTDNVYSEIEAAEDVDGIFEISYEDLEADEEAVSEVERFLEEKQYYYMPGDYFVIPYSEIRNLNITYQKENQINL